MNTLLIERIDGDEAASVALRSGSGHVIEAFCHPCSLTVGERIENALSAMDGDWRAAYLSDWPDDKKQACSIERLEKIGSYAYRGCGTVVNCKDGLVEVFGFLINFGGPLWEGIDAIEFEVVRFDIARPNIALNPDAPTARRLI
ncbi:MAG: hypothetical protein LBE24_00545 [Methylobacillus sp.]|jgi:hypothetical protein|nr:hypothetical protein [Methylobacillus sp.]